MNSFNHAKPCCSLFAAGMALLASLGVQAELRLDIPGETSGPPFYARLEFPQVDPGLIPNNGQWAAMVMYRQPDCIPENFNLLTIFDVPAAFDCPLNNITGYEVYENAPGVDPAPIRSRLTAVGPVPVWFVDLTEFEQAAANGVITIADFEAMPSLRVGSADFYDELLRPNGSNPAGFIHINARGSFDNGDRFRLTYTSNGNFGSEFSNLPRSNRTRIEFRGAEDADSKDPQVFPFSGHWMDPANPGQGVGIHPVRATDYMFGTLFFIDEFGQQVWYALDATAFDGLTASISVLLSHGADPEQPNGVSVEQVGEMTIEFLGCRAARASYQIDGTERTMNLVSLVPADDCAD